MSNNTKGLHVCNSPTCTLSQNGYGDMHNQSSLFNRLTELKNMRSEIEERRGPMDNTAVFGARHRRLESRRCRMDWARISALISRPLSLSDVVYICSVPPALSDVV